MINVIEFFRNLPKKRCKSCGNQIKEMADSYRNICDDCDHPAR